MDVVILLIVNHINFSVLVKVLDSIGLHDPQVSTHKSSSIVLVKGCLQDNLTIVMTFLLRCLELW